jgi:type II secretory ATPase GspE/PulE/Tfp pilus assembly ATPase PilB-like protein
MIFARFYTREEGEKIMAIFDNNSRKIPLGVELIRRGIITEKDIDAAITYQKENPDKKLGEIFHILKVCKDEDLLNALGEILGVKPIIINPLEMDFNFTTYISTDVVRQHKVLPFALEDNKIKVAFADPSDKKVENMIRMILINKGLTMETYVTFASYIEAILKNIDTKADSTSTYDEYGQDITQLIDNIIRSAMTKRASDIHFEPMDGKLRIRFRIDGELVNITTIDKSKQPQIIGRLKAISNMHQEKQESQDGRIITYPEFNIRVSSQKNVYGEKFVLRLLKKNANIKRLFDLGFPDDKDLLDKCFNKRNSVALVAAPTGEGKTTTLYSVMAYLNDPSINITTIEDPVEIRIAGLNQVEVTANASFADNLRTILRQDPDIVLVGEIRDKETAEIAIQAGQTGHFVLSTIHTVDSIEAITRLRKLGISSYDISSVLATVIAQRLVRRICSNCAKERPLTEQEIEEFKMIGKRFNYEFDLEGKHTFEPVGCEKCNNTGFYERIAAVEILLVNERLKDLISSDASPGEIRKAAFECGYRPLVVDAFNKVLQGVTTITEVKKKLAY